MKNVCWYILWSIYVSDAFFRALPHSTPSPMETPAPARLAPPPVMCPLRGADSSSFTASLRELERVRRQHGNVVQNYKINSSDMIVVSLGILLYLWPSERWLCFCGYLHGFMGFMCFLYKQLFNNVGRSLCVCLCVCAVWLVLGANELGGCWNEAERKARWLVFGEGQFRPAIHPQPQLSLAGSHAPHAHGALQR